MSVVNSNSPNNSSGNSNQQQSNNINKPATEGGLSVLPSALNTSSTSTTAPPSAVHSPEGTPVEASVESTPQTSTRQIKMDNVEMRLLVENAVVGAIIGKGGANVKRVREECCCYVSILKSEFRGVEERVMVLKGSEQQTQEAIGMIAQLILNADTPQAFPKDTETTAIRLLIHKNQVGCIIGKGGSVIKQTQEESGARIQISSEALPNSSEKAASIHGTPEQIQHAAAIVMRQLRENPLKSTVKHYPYIPGAPLPVPLNFRAYGASGRAALLPQLPSLPLMPHSTQKIAIPTVCAGCIIGRSGSVIRDLRAQSGSTISIADPEPDNPDERVVTLTGTAQSIQTAVYLIRQLVEQYQPRETQQTADS